MTNIKTNIFSSRKANYIITFLIEFIILFISIILFRIAKQKFGDLGFAEFALTKRTLAFIHPLLFLGLGVAIPRYIAFAESKKDSINSGTYFMSGFLVVSAVSILFLAFLFLFRIKAAFLLFGSESYTDLIFPVSITIMGLVLHSLIYSYYRGIMKMMKANLVQLLNIALLPSLAFFFSSNIIQLFYYTGIFVCILSTFFLISILINIKPSRLNIKKAIKELLFYGLQRLPGDFGLTLFFSLPAYFILHTENMEVAGYVSFALTLVSMTGAAFAPLSLILLPEASKMIASGNFSDLKITARKLILFTTTITIFGIIIFELFAKTILTIYLSDANPELVFICKILILSASGYTTYVALRSIIDAAYVKSINTLNIFFSLIVFLSLSGILYLANSSYYNILISFVISLVFLGLITITRIKKIFKNEQL